MPEPGDDHLAVLSIEGLQDALLRRLNRLADARQHIRELREQIAQAQADIAHIKALLDDHRTLIPFPVQSQPEPRPKRRRAQAE